jgi:hypothetical protein
MLDKNPEQRICLDEIKTHPWIVEIDPEPEAPEVPQESEAPEEQAEPEIPPAADKPPTPPLVIVDSLIEVEDSDGSDFEVISEVPEELE